MDIHLSRYPVVNICSVGGGFKDLFGIFSPKFLGKSSNLTCAYVSNGEMFNHQLVLGILKGGGPRGGGVPGEP